MIAPTRDEVIQMARESDNYADKHGPAFSRRPDEWRAFRDERFAALVAAAKESELNDGLTIAYMHGYEKGKDVGAAAARADEREACALLADDLPAPEACNTIERHLWDVATVAVGDAIRERGKP